MRYNPRRVVVLPAARTEVEALPVAERVAVEKAIQKLQLGGETLGFPHTSAVRGVDEMLRELRPRRGRSRWRALYRRIGPELVVAAIVPEAESDPRGFRRGCDEALRRLHTYRQTGEEGDE